MTDADERAGRAVVSSGSAPAAAASASSVYQQPPFAITDPRPLVGMSPLTNGIFTPEFTAHNRREQCHTLPSRC